MEEKRSFTTIKKTMESDELEKFCKKIAEEYANSEPNFSRRYFCKQYRISESCYDKIKELAIVTDLVTDDIVEKMLAKSIANQNLHSNGAGISSIKKFAEMYKERHKHIALSYGEDDVREITEYFADNPNISKQDIAKERGIPTKVLEIILARAIEENIVDDSIVERIEERSLRNTHPSNNQRIMTYFEGLKKKREAFKCDTSFE